MIINKARMVSPTISTALVLGCTGGASCTSVTLVANGDSCCGAEFSIISFPVAAQSGSPAKQSVSQIPSCL